MKWQFVRIHEPEVRRYLVYACGDCDHKVRIYDDDPYIIDDVKTCPNCGAKFERD